MTRNIKTKAALGEIPLEMLSDMGSIPIISTMNMKRGRIAPLFMFIMKFMWELNLGSTPMPDLCGNV